MYIYHNILIDEKQKTTPYGEASERFSTSTHLDRLARGMATRLGITKVDFLYMPDSNIEIETGNQVV